MLDEEVRGSKKITAALNISIQTAGKGPNTGSRFASILGLMTDKSKSIEFTVNGSDTVQALEDLAASFRAKGFSPVAEIECASISEVPEMVEAKNGVPAHTKTWAQRPVHRLGGDVVIARIVGKEKIPTATIAADLLEKACDVLDAE